MVGLGPGEVSTAILLSLERLFELDNVTRVASVELWVLLTTLLLVVRFLIDFNGPWFGNPRRTFIVLTLEILNQNMVIYTMGLMQLSGARKVNDYFQVWAVLLVTLQYSVKIGRPYTRSKQIPLLDLMSSFWSANLLRVQTFYLLRIPLWTIWSLNAVRIIMLFVSSGKGEENNQESMRLVSDYMIDEHNLPCSRSSTSTLDEQKQEQEQKSSDMAIRWHEYKYLVYGEHRVLKQVHDQEGSKSEEKRTLFSCFRKRGRQGKSESSSSYKIQLDPDDVHKKQLVTIETIWKDDNGSGLLGVGKLAERRRDLCLSFALYKLLRRRFYDLPMHEMDQPESKKKMRRLIFGYVLENRERAFRISGAELSFLQDLFYSKHATLFSGGLRVPLWSLLLSLCLAAATGYIAYPAQHIPERMDPADRNKITHGVFITRLMIGIIVLKEMLEVVLYLSSRWAKVLMLCMYAQLQHRRPVVEAAMRWFVLCFGAFCSMLCRPFCFCCKAKLTKVQQQNLLVTVCLPRLVPVRLEGIGPLPLFTVRMVSLRGQILGTAGLEGYTKDALLSQLKGLKNREGIAIVDNYFSNVFGSNTSNKVVEWQCNHKLAVDTHIILVWHIATSLCEIYSFFNKVKVLRAAGRCQRPFVEDPKEQTTHHTREPNGSSLAPTAAHQVQHGEKSESAAWSDQYSTAVTLSNYCVYLVSKALVPDNRLVARKVLDEVIREIDYAIVGSRTHRQREKLLRCLTLKYVYDRLMETVDKPCQNPCHQATSPDDHPRKDIDIGCSLTKMGAELGKKLTEVYADAESLWTVLSNFWTRFLLHLAANTGAATHHQYLAGDSELITHLWVLLTHAGYRGNAIHGEQGLDQEDIPDIKVEN